MQLLLVVFFTFSLAETEVNITSSEESHNETESEIHIPSSEESPKEEIDDKLPLEAVLQKSKEFDEIPTTPDNIPYLPLIQRCSIDTDCSSETACYDGKCLNAKRFQLFPYLFRRCDSQLDCPSGNQCIINMCIPFRW